MQNHPLGKESQIIGEAIAQPPGIVLLKTAFGTERILDMLSGDQLPRIC
jgi:hydrogenase expression/formation protein HypE